MQCVKDKIFKRGFFVQRCWAGIVGVVGIVVGGEILGQERSAVVETPGVRVLTLLECVNQALEHHPEILSARQGVERARGAKVVARASLYPRVTASGSVGLQNRDLFAQQNPARDDWDPDWRAGIRISYNVYSGGGNRRQIEIAELQGEQAFIRLREAVNQVLFQTRRAFFDVLLNESRLETQRQAVDLLKRELERQKALLEVGRGTRFDVLRTEVRLSNELPQLALIEADRLASYLSLAELMGMRWEAAPGQVPFRLLGELALPRVELTERELVAMALAANPRPERWRAQAEIERRRRDNARALNIPRFDLFVDGQVRQRDGGGNFADTRTEASFGVMGRWFIFDGSEGKGRAEEAQALMKQAMTEMDASRVATEYDVRRAYARLRQSETAVREQEGNVAKAEEALELSRAAVEAGRGTQFDILQATVDLTEARNVAMAARHRYNVALAQLQQILFLEQGQLALDIPNHESTGEVQW